MARTNWSGADAESRLSLSRAPHIACVLADILARTYSRQAARTMSSAASFYSLEAEKPNGTKLGFQVRRLVPPPSSRTAACRAEGCTHTECARKHGALWAGGMKMIRLTTTSARRTSRARPSSS